MSKVLNSKLQFVNLIHGVNENVQEATSVISGKTSTKTHYKEAKITSPRLYVPYYLVILKNNPYLGYPA